MNIQKKNAKGSDEQEGNRGFVAERSDPEEHIALGFSYSLGEEEVRCCTSLCGLQAGKFSGQAGWISSSQSSGLH